MRTTLHGFVSKAHQICITWYSLLCDRNALFASRGAHKGHAPTSLSIPEVFTSGYNVLLQKPHRCWAIKQEREIGENITYLVAQHICWGKCKGFLYDKKDMAMRLYKSFDGGSYATMLWQIKDMRSPTKIKFYHRCPSRCDAVQAEITSKGKKWLRSKGMQNSYRRRLQPRRRLQLKKNGLSKVAMRSQLMKRAIWLG